MQQNPYAAPATPEAADLPVAPPSHGWWVEDGRLWVEDGAQLPMVDPFNGRSEDRMVLREFRINHRPPWFGRAMGAMLGGFVMAMLLAFLGIGALYAYAAVLCVLGLLGMFLLFVVSLGLKRVAVRFFVTGKSDGRIMISRGNAGVIVIGFSGMILLPLSRLVPVWVGYGAAAVFLISLICQIVIWFSHRRLTCRVRSHERYEIRGVHPAAMEYLENFRRGSGIPA